MAYKLHDVLTGSRPWLIREIQMLISTKQSYCLILLEHNCQNSSCANCQPKITAADLKDGFISHPL